MPHPCKDLLIEDYPPDQYRYQIERPHVLEAHLTGKTFEAKAERERA